MPVHPALVGKAGELMVAAELMRRGVEVAHPYSDVGVDLLAFRLSPGETIPTKLAAIQVKSASEVAFNFHQQWLRKAGYLVLVWNVVSTPEFYIFDSIARVEEALGPTFTASSSWINDRRYAVTKPNSGTLSRMEPHRDRWERIIKALA